MSQRDSGYERKERDCYETPEWVTEALIPHISSKPEAVWEPACGSGKMLVVLKKYFCDVHGSDIETGEDFLNTKTRKVDAIITNPPYNLAEKFIEFGLLHTAADRGVVAMLLRTDYDHAKTRQHLFGNCGLFAKKVVLTKRIKWFEDSKGQPSFNHAWFIWDHKHSGPPVLAYC